MKPVVFTIGHSTHTTERFLALLAQHGIAVIADVRSQPYSRTNPQFNRERIVADLGSAGMDYVFLGRELGARSDDETCYANGRVQYDRIAQTAAFQEGLDRVVRGAARYRVALMCAEKDPLVCHRAILVSRHLVGRGLEVRHVLESGQVEGHDAALDRLLRELGMPEQDLFRERGELIAEAYERRGREIAYELKNGAASDPLRGALGR